MMQAIWERLKKSMGVEEKPKSARPPTASEQKAIDRAIPRRYEPKPKEKTVKKPVKKPTKKAEVEDETDVVSSTYDFRRNA